MTRCDICLKQADRLRKIGRQYSIDNVKEICVECFSAIQKQEDAINRILGKLYDSARKRMLPNLYSKLSGRVFPGMSRDMKEL